MQKIKSMIFEGKKFASIKTGKKQTSMAKSIHADRIKLLTGLLEMYLTIHKEDMPAIDGSIERKPMSFSRAPSLSRKRVKIGPRHTVKKNVPEISPIIK
ncbi:MAG: hypothetical protein NC906_01490 [Candidatus Omnitrophica bacterium]|nr:hypothetical protein [Candidatus Omnitrophota bacterium]